MDVPSLKRALTESINTDTNFRIIIETEGCSVGDSFTVQLVAFSKVSNTFILEGKRIDDSFARYTIAFLESKLVAVSIGFFSYEGFGRVLDVTYEFHYDSTDAQYVLDGYGKAKLCVEKMGPTSFYVE